MISRSGYSQHQVGADIGGGDQGEQGEKMRDTQSPGTDSALGAETTSPDLRHQLDFADEREETFTCFGENDGADYDQR